MKDYSLCPLCGDNQKRSTHKLAEHLKHWHYEELIERSKNPADPLFKALNPIFVFIWGHTSLGSRTLDNVLTRADRETDA